MGVLVRFIPASGVTDYSHERITRKIHRKSDVPVLSLDEFFDSCRWSGWVVMGSPSGVLWLDPPFFNPLICFHRVRYWITYYSRYRLHQKYFLKVKYMSGMAALRVPYNILFLFVWIKWFMYNAPTKEPRIFFSLWLINPSYNHPGFQLLRGSESKVSSC